MTLLAKAGVPKDVQLALGYHTQLGQKSAQAYDGSRLAAVVPLFREVLLEHYKEIAWSGMNTEKVHLEL